MLAGCQTKPAPGALPLKLPELPLKWTGASGSVTQPPEPWLEDFATPELTSLVREALRQNFSLQAVAARVNAARAQANIAGDDLLPDAELDLSAGRRQTGSAGNRSVSSSYDLAGSISWQVDLWQRLAHAERAAIAEAAASLSDYRAARLSLAAEISRQWFLLNEAGLQQQLAERTENSYQQNLQVIEQQYRSGLSSSLDLRLARNNLATAQSTRSLRQRQYDERRRQLEILLGRYPKSQLASTYQLPQLNRQVPAGLPSSLLERRPDLKAAAQRLSADQERLFAAEKNRLPSFRLTASGGTASDQLYRLLDWDYLVWSLAGSLTQSLFDGGRRSAEQDLSRARLDEQTATYAQTVLTAFREVETALAAEAYLQEQENALKWATEESAAALLLAEDRYRQGLNDIITLLEAQRRAFVAESGLLTTRRQRLENRVDLYLALGGPFASPEHEEQP